MSTAKITGIRIMQIPIQFIQFLRMEFSGQWVFAKF